MLKIILLGSAMLALCACTSVPVNPDRGNDRPESTQIGADGKSVYQDRRQEQYEADHHMTNDAVIGLIFGALL